MDTPKVSETAVFAKGKSTRNGKIYSKMGKDIATRVKKMKTNRKKRVR